MSVVTGMDAELRGRAGHLSGTTSPLPTQRHRSNSRAQIPALGVVLVAAGRAMESKTICICKTLLGI